MERLMLIIVEAALELVPVSIARHPSVRRYASKRGKKPTEVLLDRSYHHYAMSKLPNNEKRGRPDITYHMLLDATSTPLYKKGVLQIYVHTINDYVIRVGELVRLPRSYHRFVGLMEDLFKRNRIESEEGSVLLEVKRQGIRELLTELSPDESILLREGGREVGLEELAKLITSFKRVVVGIGGFPRGDFSKESVEAFHREASIGPEAYDAALVLCRVLYEVEKSALGDQR